MPREIITLQVGQCGNQIGCRFWELALREHSKKSKRKALYDESMSTFFRNTDGKGTFTHTHTHTHKHITSLNTTDRDMKRGKIGQLRARAVLIDMEEGVVNRVMRSPLGELFRGDTQSITAPSGAGNNWAFGHMVCGPDYDEEIFEKIRRQAEACDSLQSFFIHHSLGGGTGSGLGTYLLRRLRDEMPKVCRFCVSVFPSEDDDVITSPYNGMLALSQLSEHADCVLPIENQALLQLIGGNKKNTTTRNENSPSSLSLGRLNIRSKIKGTSFVPIWSHAKDAKSSMRKKENGGQSAYDSMNHIAASLIANMTCSSRFEGSLNVDLNEITTNLVPYRGLHFLVPSMSPLDHLTHNSTGGPRGLTSMFSSVRILFFFSFFF